MLCAFDNSALRACEEENFYVSLEVEGNTWEVQVSYETSLTHRIPITVYTGFSTISKDLHANTKN